MNAVHDPVRQLSYLQQCLSQSKKPLGLFLGAGCPMSIRVGADNGLPLIPDIAGITVAVREELSKQEDCCVSLATVEDHFVKDGREKPTIEDMLSHVRGLRAVAGKEGARGLTAEQLDKLDTEICRVIHALASRSLPSSSTPYHRIAMWIDATVRARPVEVFTTNYDLLMEEAFEDCRVPYFDGFAGSRRPFFDIRAMEEDLLPDRWARLWKLHGSINWYQDTTRGVLRGAANDETCLRRVIHPSHLKYEESRRLPYLAMIDRLRAFLKQPSSALFLCGYSFRDDHINEVIMQGLQGTQTAIAFALLFSSLGGYPKAKKLALQRSNLSLLARDGAIVCGAEGGWSEKEAETTSSSNMVGVTWLPVDGKEGKCTAEWGMGDFLVFGEFLHEIVGQARERMEVTDAK